MKMKLTMSFCLVAVKMVIADPFLPLNYCLAFCLDIWKEEIFGEHCHIKLAYLGFLNGWYV